MADEFPEEPPGSTAVEDDRMLAALQSATAGDRARLQTAVRAVQEAPTPLTARHGGQPDANGVVQMPYFEYHPAVDELIEALYQAHVVADFEWMTWEGASRYHDASAVQQAPIADAVRLITAVVRRDRFSEGTIAGALEDGRLIAAVQRILGEWEQPRREGGLFSRVQPVEVAQLRLDYAGRIAALVDALRGIPEHLAPTRRASGVAVREQIYYGWELPLARAQGARLLFGKYELDGWWSEAAAALVTSEQLEPGSRKLERDHVEPVRLIVHDLLSRSRSAEETEQLLTERLVTCTVLVDEHRLLGRAPGDGWDRYRSAGIAWRRGLPDSSAV